MTLTKKTNADLSLGSAAFDTGLGSSVKSALDELASRTLSQKGSSIATGTTSVPTSGLTVSFTLNRSDFTYGYAVVWTNNAATSVQARRRQIFVVFGTDHSNAVGISGDYRAVSFSADVGTYVHYSWPMYAYAYRDDGVVSTPRFRENSPAGNRMSLKSVRINGTSLDFLWENTNLSAVNIYVNYEWRVFKLREV